MCTVFIILYSYIKYVMCDRIVLQGECACRHTEDAVQNDVLLVIFIWLIASILHMGTGVLMNRQELLQT